MKTYRVIGAVIAILGIIAIYFLSGADDESPSNGARPQQQFQMPPQKDYDFKR